MPSVRTGSATLISASGRCPQPVSARRRRPVPGRAAAPRLGHAAAIRSRPDRGSRPGRPAPGRASCHGWKQRARPRSPVAAGDPPARRCAGAPRPLEQPVAPRACAWRALAGLGDRHYRCSTAPAAPVAATTAARPAPPDMAGLAGYPPPAAVSSPPMMMAAPMPGQSHQHHVAVPARREPGFGPGRGVGVVLHHDPRSRRLTRPSARRQARFGRTAWSPGRYRRTRPRPADGSTR